MQSESTDD
jgi:sugar phosphate permease